MIEFYPGVDPGQVRDPTAIVILRRVPIGSSGAVEYHTGHIERLPLDTTYPDVVHYIRRLLSRAPFLGRSEQPILDATGIGRPVADSFEGEGIRPVKVLITAGNDHPFRDDHGFWHVAKTHLISGITKVLNAKRLHIHGDLQEALILKAELLDFEQRVTDSGQWRFGARSGAHDDLVLALGLALWRADGKKPAMNVHPDVLRRSERIVTRPSLDNFGSGRDPYVAGWPYPWRSGR